MQPLRPSARRALLLTTAALAFAGCRSAATSNMDTGDAVRVAPTAGHGAAVAAPAAPAAAAPAKPRWEVIEPGVPGDPMGVRGYRLRNGMTVLLSENREEPRLDAWITIRAGGAKDPADATGMAHYLEHMQFKGSPRLGTLDWEKEKPHLDRITALYDQLFHTTDPEQRKALYAEIDAENQKASAYAVPNELDRLYDGIGAQGLNAFTSNDQTSYTVNIPSNRIEQWARLETERLREPVYRLFQTELEAVYEEKNRAMDNPGRAVNEALLAALFPKHPYGTQTVIGHAEHLKNPSLTKMYQYFRTWYRPGNICVALAGDFDTEQVLDVLDRTLGALPAGDVPADPKWPIEPVRGVRRVEVPFKGEEAVLLAFLTVPERHADYAALVLCDMMLANGRTGLIDVNLNQAQRVRGAGAQPQGFLDAGYEILTATPKPGQSLDELESLLLEQVDRLRKGEFTDADLAATMTEFEVSEKRALESNRTRVGAMTDAFVTRQPWSERVSFLDRLKKTPKSAVVEAANRYFGSDYVAIRRVNREPDLPKIPKPNFTPIAIDPNKPHSPWFTETLNMPAKPIEPRFVVKGRDVQEVTLASGRLVHVRNPVNDVFDLTFTVSGGTDHDPKLSLALPLLDLGGAGELDGVSLKRKLYALGSTFSAAAGRDEVTISVSGLDANLAATVDLLREHFARPTGVGQDDLAKMVQRTLAGRTAQKNSPQGIGAALTEYARRGADSSFLIAPTNDAMQSWKADDLLAVARSVWDHPRTVTYVGQLAPEAVAKLVDLGPIGGTPADLRPAPERKPVRSVQTAKNRVLFVDRKMAQAQIQVSAPDGLFDRKLVPVQRVFNEMMGGSMSGIVFQEIRESRALAYDSGAFYATPGWKDDENVMIGALGTQADKAADALTVLLQILRAPPITDSRFESAIRSIDQGYRTNRAGFRRLPGIVLTWDRQGLEGDPRPWNWEQVRNMKMEDVVTWAKRFGPMPFTITVLGPKDRIDLERLKAIGDVEEIAVDKLFAW